MAGQGDRRNKPPRNDEADFTRDYVKGRQERYNNAAVGAGDGRRVRPTGNGRERGDERATRGGSPVIARQSGKNQAKPTVPSRRSSPEKQCQDVQEKECRQQDQHKQQEDSKLPEETPSIKATLPLTFQEMYDRMTSLGRQLARLDPAILSPDQKGKVDTESIMQKAALILMASAEHSRQLQEAKKRKDAKIKELMESTHALEKNYCAKIQSLMNTIMDLRKALSAEKTGRYDHNVNLDGKFQQEVGTMTDLEENKFAQPQKQKTSLGGQGDHQRQDQDHEDFWNPTSEDDPLEALAGMKERSMAANHDDELLSEGSSNQGNDSLTYIIESGGKTAQNLQKCRKDEYGSVEQSRQEHYVDLDDVFTSNSLMDVDQDMTALDSCCDSMMDFLQKAGINAREISRSVMRELPTMGNNKRRSVSCDRGPLNKAMLKEEERQAMEMRRALRNKLDVKRAGGISRKNRRLKASVDSDDSVDPPEPKASLLRNQTAMPSRAPSPAPSEIPATPKRSPVGVLIRTRKDAARKPEPAESGSKSNRVPKEEGKQEDDDADITLRMISNNPALRKKLPKEILDCLKTLLASSSEDLPASNKPEGKRQQQLDLAASHHQDSGMKGDARTQERAEEKPPAYGMGTDRQRSPVAKPSAKNARNQQKELQKRPQEAMVERRRQVSQIPVYRRPTADTRASKEERQDPPASKGRRGRSLVAYDDTQDEEFQYQPIELECRSPTKKPVQQGNGKNWPRQESLQKPLTTRPASRVASPDETRQRRRHVSAVADKKPAIQQKLGNTTPQGKSRVTSPRKVTSIGQGDEPGNGVSYRMRQTGQDMEKDPDELEEDQEYRVQLLKQLHANLKKLSAVNTNPALNEQINIAKRLYDKLKRDLTSQRKSSTSIDQQIHAFNRVLQNIAAGLLSQDNLVHDLPSFDDVSEI